MIFRVKHIILIVLIITSNQIFAQIKIAGLHYRNDTLSAIFDYDSKLKYNAFHSSVKPYIIQTPFNGVKSKFKLEKTFLKNG